MYRVFGKYCRLDIFSELCLLKPQLGYCVRIVLYTSRVSTEGVRYSLVSIGHYRENYENQCNTVIGQYFPNTLYHP